MQTRKNTRTDARVRAHIYKHILLHMHALRQTYALGIELGRLEGPLILLVLEVSDQTIHKASQDLVRARRILDLKIDHCVCPICPMHHCFGRLIALALLGCAPTRNKIEQMKKIGKIKQDSRMRQD